ncbi:serine/threonine phosphatase [Halotia branconii]|uniref:Serine/threonine phosphatase n=1 Tax=Halotia branconii CENA392 TaxID=1539056 RepID=A0AAJ6P912_9CYAN|nr:serine/threonine phosphatase [Halotia branconii]WGV25186.1 serine/threonine phosphatase [Halotia branconii CENA392]
MLICPQCKFENPHDHKFCQNCGASLTHRDCPECMTEVPINAQYCQNCGAECGTVWWAIVAQIATGEKIQEQTSEQQDKENFSNVPISPLQITIGSYLDSEQRYQVLELLPTQDENTAITEIYLRVLDCQPYQISPIDVLLANQQQDLVTPSVEVNAISNLAKAYIVLQPQNHPDIPAIHNAWQQDDMQVILIEDRSNWQYLLELWQKETTSSLQILHWCYQMTKLWTILEPVRCRQSLLELSNLRLDEDQTLALQRLYVETLDVTSAIKLPEDEEADTFVTQNPPLTVKALGQVWQTLFRQSQRTQFGSIVQILEDLELNKIQTIAHLRSRLQDIKIELEVPIPTTFEPMEEKDIAVSATLPTDELEEDIALRNDDLPTVVLSMQLSTLEDAGRTDVGRQRHHNEDCFGIETKIDKLELPRNRVLEARGLYILCDGMGGHAGGEVASELAVNTLRKYFQTHWVGNQLPTKDSIREAVNLANQAIYEVNQQDARSGVGRMGTTLVMLLIQDTQAAVAHVGDSRLYSLTRKRGLEQITVDHEVGQREIARGVEASIAYARPDAYQLTQALGPRDEKSINPDVNFFEINEDSLLLLVSDGLSDNDLLENHWQTHLNPLLSSGANLERGVTELIDLANQYNGHDNITAILVRAKVRPNMEGTGD